MLYVVSCVHPVAVINAAFFKGRFILINKKNNLYKYSQYAKQKGIKHKTIKREKKKEEWNHSDYFMNLGTMCTR